MTNDEQERLTESLDNLELRLAQQAAIGEDIRDARKEAAFIHLFGSAKRAAIDARGKLVDVDPENQREIRRLQNEVKRYEDMALWIRTAVIEGQHAFDQLQHLRGEKDGSLQQED